MKPPVRTRVAPQRLDIDPKFLQLRTRYLWTRREKLQLLRALKAQSHLREPDLNLLKQQLPKKKAGEIMNFILMLKGRVARESVRKEYKRYRAERCWEEDSLAPIEVWTELAEKVSGKLDEVLTAAFSQILTIAATEPISLLHSIPTKQMKIPGKMLFLDPVSPSRKSPLFSPAHSSTEPSSPEARAQSKQECADSLSSEEEELKPNMEEKTVDFENIYKYLFALSRCSQLPKLSSFESAVLLDLLLSLPKELEQLDCLALRSHMYQSFRSLNMPCRTALEPQDSQAKEGEDKAKSANRPPCKIKEETKSVHSESSTSEASEDEKNSSSEDPTWHDPSTSCASTQTSIKALVQSKEKPVLDSQVSWKDLGVCPLNPFLVPLKLMCQVDNMSSSSALVTI